ncbi:MAG: FUN14 domain-containing protein [Chromatiaceae bacterium]|nr:FUN14 domain-containing protein [Chromatiaceae bacterium]
MQSPLITRTVSGPARSKDRTAFAGTLAASPASSPESPPVGAESLFSSGFFLRLGFSFIVGLAVGYALKVAFKIALVVCGLLLILLFSLQYNGLIEVNWTGMESNYDGIAAWLAAYGGVLKDFMADHLSSAASFTTGLLLGLRL